MDLDEEEARLYAPAIIAPRTARQEIYFHCLWHLSFDTFAPSTLIDHKENAHALPSCSHTIPKLFGVLDSN
jgi:hypothetical protein